MTEVINRQEIRLPGMDDDHLIVTLWSSPSGECEARFTIHQQFGPADQDGSYEVETEIYIPLENVLPLVLGLGGSVTRYIDSKKEDAS